MPTATTSQTRTGPEPKRKRGNPLFGLMARTYDFWTDRFRHDPKHMTPAARGRNIAAFTLAIQGQVLEANPNGVTSRDFKQAVEHVKARLDPEAWQAELDKATGRIEAAILAYADSGYHRKQAERQAASPRRHFDNWLSVALSTWIDAARTKGLIDRDGVAKHVRISKTAETLSPIDLDALCVSVRDRLLADAHPSLRRFREMLEPAGTPRARDHRQRQAATLAPYLIETWPADAADPVKRLVDDRTAEVWKGNPHDTHRSGGRWKYQLALFLNECLTHQGDKDV